MYNCIIIIVFCFLFNYACMYVCMLIVCMYVNSMCAMEHNEALNIVILFVAEMYQCIVRTYVRPGLTAPGDNDLLIKMLMKHLTEYSSHQRPESQDLFYIFNCF